MNEWFVRLPDVAPLLTEPDRGRRLLLSQLPCWPIAALTLPSSTEAAPDPAVAAPLPALPPATTLRYQLYFGDASRDMAVAEVAYRLEHGDSRYRLTTDGQAIGVVALFYSGTLTQTSVGLIAADGLRPERYTERRGRRPERVVVFDRARRIMTGGGDPADVALPAGTQDRLSIFFQLGLLARGRPGNVRKGNRFQVPLASLKRVDTPTFTVHGSETLKTGRAPVEAVRINVRNESDADDPVFDVWLAASMMMLPARIRMQERDGKVIDQLLLSSG